MIGKIAIRNMKKSMSDYAVYFVTLIIGISVFYVFNAISDQTVVININKSDYDIIDLLKETISVASVIVSFVLAFLVVYASNFLMKRRKKEFGVYMLLGMEKRKIAGILIVETLCIGIISLMVGLVLGIVLSQGMSVLVARMFEADMSKYTFEVSPAAAGKTLLYFLMVYVLVLVLDVFVVGKSRLIRLLNSEKKTEKNTARNPWVCFFVFVAAAIVLGHAYYRVTAGAADIKTTQQFVIEIVKGIVTTFAIFWSLSGLLIFLSKMRKKSYYRGINSFTTKEISSRVNTNVFAGSIICLLLFITICIFSGSFSIKKSIDDNLKTLAAADVNILKRYDSTKDMSSISSILKEKKVDMDMFAETVEVQMYYCGDDVENAFVIDESSGYMMPNRMITVSDYEKVARFYGLQPVYLADDEYTIVSNYDYGITEMNTWLAAGRTLRLSDRELHPASATCTNGYIEISSNPSNFGFMVVPDNAAADEQMKLCALYYIANYNESYQKGTEYIDKKLCNAKFFAKKSVFAVETRSNVYQRSIGLASLIVFLGLYLGIVFLLASSALLALKELSQAADNRDKYTILRKIGVDERMIHQSLLRQNAIFFGIPLILAVVHAVFGIRVTLQIVEVFGKTGLLPAIVGTGLFILAIYMLYFVVTYRCSRKIID